MVYSITYTRPPFVSGSQASLSDDEKQKSIQESIRSGNSCMSGGIPPALSFDRIVSGGTCPPVTVRDFMNYLKYIEYSAENLQFYMWFQDYSARWAKLPESTQSLSPAWSSSQADAVNNPVSALSPDKISPQIAAAFKNSDFAVNSPRTPVDRAEAFSSSPTIASFDDRRDVQSDYGSSVGDEKTLFSNTSYQVTAEQAFEDAGMKWQPFTTQPYRDEITRIVSIYLADGSARELNLSDRERRAALHALQHTTHPSALAGVAASVEYSLRRQAHPNFIRWTICNGNRPRVVFARGLGVATVLLALLADLLLVLSSAARGWRVLPLPLWFLGFATLIAAWKGMCVVLHGLHHRHLRPWELFADDPEELGGEELRQKGGEGFGAALEGFSRESLVSGERNSFEEEPWVPRYRRRNLVRKVFDRQIWVREPALRQIQDTIFVQSLLGSLLLSAICVGIFCAVPHGNLF